MIEGFESQTCELSPEELSLVPAFVRSFNNHIGRDKAVTNKDIRAGFERCGVKLSDVRVRKIVNYIRVNDLVSLLLATSDGYFVATTEEEVASYICSLRERAMAIDRVAKALSEQKLRRWK